MPVAIYYGEDDFTLDIAIKKLRNELVNPDWEAFNFTKISPHPWALEEGLTLALTPPFAERGRLVLLENNRGECSKEKLNWLEQSLEAIPPTNTLLLTSKTKPDERLLSSKLLLKKATVVHFPLLPAWKTNAIELHIAESANSRGVSLTRKATKLLAESIGNNTRRLNSELEKLAIYSDGTTLDTPEVAILVPNTTATAIALANAIRTSDTALALELLRGLQQLNEPSLRIIATLTTLFRQWLWVKGLMQSEKNDEALARSAEIANPKRLYYIKQEVASVTVGRLKRILGQLLELEIQLKSRGEPQEVLILAIVKLCQH